MGFPLDIDTIQLLQTGYYRELFLLHDLLVRAKNPEFSPTGHHVRRALRILFLLLSCHHLTSTHRCDTPLQRVL